MKLLLRSISILKGLHWVTWVVMGMFALALMLIVVPGDLDFRSIPHRSQSWFDICIELRDSTYDSYNDSGAPFTYVYVYEHGWPFSYLARAIVEQDFESPGAPSTYYESETWMNRFSWYYYDNWPFGANASVFRLWALLVDLVLATTIVATAGGLTEWRIRSRRGFLRFGMWELLVGIAVLSIAMGYYAYHRRLHDIESRNLTPTPSSGVLPPASLLGCVSQNGTLSTYQRYVGPVWLRRLCGGDYYLPYFYHDTNANVWFDVGWRETMDALCERPYLVEISFNAPLTLAAVSRLAECKNLQRLVLPQMESDAAPTIEGTDDPVFGPEHFSLLQELSFYEIVLRGSAIEPRHVATIASQPKVRQILLVDTAVTTEDVLALQQRFPHIKIEITDYY